MKPTIKTFTGRYVDVANPEPAMFDIMDIATALSRMPRFSGHTRHAPYSVAQHSMLVAEIVVDLYGRKATRSLRRYALLHDASEAYLCDIASPIKQLLPDYREIERRVQAAILERFEIAPTKRDIERVKIADAVACKVEAIALMAIEFDKDGKAVDPEWSVFEGLPETLCEVRYPNESHAARNWFLAEWERTQ